MNNKESVFTLEEKSINSIEKLKAFQQQAFSEFMINDFPKKDENWLYFQPENLRHSFQNPLKSFNDTDSKKSDEADITIFNGYKYTSLNPNITVYDVNETIPDYIKIKRGVSTNSLSLLNSAFFQNIIFIEIKESQKKTITIDCIQKTSDNFGVISPRLFIYCHKNVEASVLLRHINDVKDQIVVNTFVEVCCKENSNLELVQIQISGNNNRFLTTIFDIEKQSKTNSVILASDGDLTRHDTEINVLGEDSTINLKGLGLINKNKIYSHHLAMTHYVTDTFGDQVFKNILTDEAKSEFSGLVNVKKGSHKTISNQLNQNLVLSDKARALSRPKLIIDADDVECSHGCTIGQLNDEEIFYLKSRGMSEKESKSILIYGFAKDIIDSIQSAEIRKMTLDRLKNHIESFIKTNVK